MNTQWIRTALVVLLLLWLATSITFAAISENTIAPEAVLDAQGRHLVVTVQLACPAGEKVHLRATVTQRETGAVAERRFVRRCTGTVEHWPVRMVRRGTATFAAGAAEACALAITRDSTGVTDVRQWCRAEGITLVNAK